MIVVIASHRDDPTVEIRFIPDDDDQLKHLCKVLVDFKYHDHLFVYLIKDPTQMPVELIRDINCGVSYDS